MRNRDFRISHLSRNTMDYNLPLFETSNSTREMYHQAQRIALSYNKNHEKEVKASELYSSAILHLVYQMIISRYLRGTESDPFSRMATLARRNSDCMDVLECYREAFPTHLEGSAEMDIEEEARAFFVHQVLQSNPAILEATGDMLDQSSVQFPHSAKAIINIIGSYMEDVSILDSYEDDLFSFLTYPARLFPDSLKKQLDYIADHWASFINPELINDLLNAGGYIHEERMEHVSGGPGPIQVPDFNDLVDEECFSPDTKWMPNVVMMAKSTLVWLDQLSKKYRREITRLDQIPDEELDLLKDSGFTALWLIGLWERSQASKKIKMLCGNQEAEASAYSIKSYDIYSRIGGWQALENLRARCASRGIKLASDMVPNHTGLDSDWMTEHPEYFMRQSSSPFPSYTFNGPDLSDNPDIEIKLEDHYFNRTDAAVTFRYHNRKTGETSYVFHGNDGTTMPWNDTAQLDFLNPVTREAVISKIIDVARNFQIIRFDAAMTLAKKHIQRLWYPKTGCGADIAGRTAYSMSDEEFNRRIPNEFWREVVDRIAKELPDTLLLAEAFWLMEGYFVRTLGIHRVYNSAFMHLLKNQENEKFRSMIKSTLEFDPEILKRYVNFMSNPDEETAIEQFGDGDKYFGVCTLLATMPGLPMFGHGQIEGFREKYGMEYQKAYWDEQPNRYLVEKHKTSIFPLLKMRKLFSGSKNFQMFDVVNDNGQVEQSVYAYVNGDENDMAFVLYNNQYEHVEGKVMDSVPKLVRLPDGSRKLERVSLAESVRLSRGIRKFFTFKDFSEDLTYLMPCSTIYNNGALVSLNGYETKIYTDIHEIEDTDGVYEKLFRKLLGKGVADLDKEIHLMYLEPFFNACEAIRTDKFRKDLKALLLGRSTSSSRKDLILAVGTCYAYMEELSGLFTKLGLSIHETSAKTILEIVDRLEKTCSETVFKNGNALFIDEFASSMTAAFLVIPFVSWNCSFDDACNASRTLMLDKVIPGGIDICSRCAILLSENPKTFSELFELQNFRDLLGVNTYNGTTWYRGENMQECFYMKIFSDAFFSESLIDGKLTREEVKAAEREIQHWLERNHEAKYNFDNLKSRQ